MIRMRPKTVIGWVEYVSLPEWGIKSIKAKIDSGARSSAIHVEDVQELSNNRISFHVIVDGKKRVIKKVIARTLKRGRVKSSTGARTHRWYVKTQVVIGGRKRDILVNLTDRGEMNYRMLIGRKALEDDFLIDVSRSYLLKKNKLGGKRT